MLNHKTESTPLRSSLALKILCAIYPPPPGSAPGYQNAHHCRPMFTRKVRAGRVHKASELNGREKSGKKDVASPAVEPVAARIKTSRASRLSIPPHALTAYQATAITMLIFKTNWNRSVQSTPHNPPSAT